MPRIACNRCNAKQGLRGCKALAFKGRAGIFQGAQMIAEIGNNAQPMKFAVACGGTGGHIFPGLATAGVLQQRGHTVTLWLAGKDIEGLATQGWDGPVLTVNARGLPSRLSLRAPVAMLRLASAVFKSSRLMRRNRPDALLAMGSYASVGPVLAARFLKVPIVLHEANAVPGRATTWLAPMATVVGGAFDAAGAMLRARRFELVGMPIRGELEKAARTPGARKFPDSFTVLVLGGSRGAHALNLLACEALTRMHAGGRALAVIHLAGKADAQEISRRYSDAGVPHETHAFLADMRQAYLSADFALCRAGASTCSELSHFGLPSLLVPYPHAVHGHQTANAAAFASHGASEYCEEKSLTAPALAERLSNLLSNPPLLERMGRAAASIMPSRASSRLADLVEAAGAGNA